MDAGLAMLGKRTAPPPALCAIAVPVPVLAPPPAAVGAAAPCTSGDILEPLGLLLGLLLRPEPPLPGAAAAFKGLVQRCRSNSVTSGRLLLLLRWARTPLPAAALLLPGTDQQAVMLLLLCRVARGLLGCCSGEPLPGEPEPPVRLAECSEASMLPRLPAGTTAQATGSQEVGKWPTCAACTLHTWQR